MVNNGKKNKEAKVLEKLSHAKVLVDYEDYQWLLENYKDLLEDLSILKSEDLMAAEKEVGNGKVSSWKELKSALNL